MALKVCLAGATGWAGSELARSIAEIDVLAHRQWRGVLACGNFALTVVLLQKFAEPAARLIPQWEIIDYAHDDKVIQTGIAPMVTMTPNRSFQRPAVRRR